MHIRDFYSRLLGGFSISSPLHFDQKTNILEIPEYHLAVLLISIVFSHM